MMPGITGRFERLWLVRNLSQNTSQLRVIGNSRIAADPVDRVAADADLHLVKTSSMTAAVTTPTCTIGHDHYFILGESDRYPAACVHWFTVCPEQPFR